MVGHAEPRGLLVLADGAQAAFAAAVVAELDGLGNRWNRGAGAGLGAELAVRGVLGESGEGAEEWRRQGRDGCPLLRSCISAARESLGEEAEVMALPDPWRLSGWLDRNALAAHFGSGPATWPSRLASRAARCAVAVADLGCGVHRWFELSDAPTDRVTPLLQAAAAFPAGWGPVEGALGGESGLFAGGVEAADRLAGVLGDEPIEWDIVCGFPVPAIRRQGLGASLMEQVQRRAEIAAVGLVSQLCETDAAGQRRLFAPSEAVYARWACRDSADLGIEYPLPWERNGELVLALLSFGAFVARASSGR